MPPGLERIDRIVVMENHDAAYHVWRGAGAKQRILVHIDAHHDMWWVRDGNPITIADFICPALKEDLIREVFWVVREEAWDTAKARKPVVRHVKEIVKRYPKPHHRLKIDDGEISVQVLGKA